MLEEGLVKTKYFLSVENVAFFDEHFLAEIYDTAEAVRAEERRQGKPLSVSFVPKMLETCDEEPSMWGRRINQSHIMFDPDLHHHKASDTTYFRAGNVNEVTLLTFADDDGEGAGTARAKEWAETLPDRFEETGVPGARYVHFVEDHVYLAETAFYMDHLDYVTHSDSMWKDDHFYLAAVPMFFNRGVVLVNSVAQMHWFCDWTLEVMHIIAWRRLEAHMITSCQLQELIFGVSPAAQNCWAWMKHYKTRLFRNIFVPKVQEDFPAFRPDADLSSLRHANLIMAAFLITSHNEFRFFAREDSTEWIESTDALSELDDMLRQPEDSHIGERYVSIRQRYVDVFSEEYKAKGFIPSMPGTYQRHLSTFDLPDKVHKTLEGGIVLDFPAHRLCHTGPIAKSDVSASFLANLMDYSIAIIEHTDIHKFEFLLWADCTNDKCPGSVGVLKRVEPTDQIRIPAFDGDASVRVISFSYGIMTF